MKHVYFKSWPARLLALVMVLSLMFGHTLANDFVSGLLEKVRQKYGEEAYQHMHRLRELASELASANEFGKVSQVNDFVNQNVLFVDDSNLWNMEDYWATPLETFGRGGGDCEDLSIAKFMLLKKMGIPSDKLRLTYVRARMPSGNVRPHMVLAYYPSPDSDPYILDNLKFELIAASRRNDLFPIFSFNEAGMFLANQPSVRAGSSTNISKWRDVLARMRQDGLD